MIVVGFPLTSKYDWFAQTMCEFGFGDEEIGDYYATVEMQRISFGAKRAALNSITVMARDGDLLPSSASSRSSADDHGRGASLE